MMLLIYQDFITENFTVRFTIPVFSVIFKNSAAITNTLPDQIKIERNYLKVVYGDTSSIKKSRINPICDMKP